MGMELLMMKTLMVTENQICTMMQIMIALKNIMVKMMMALKNIMPPELTPTPLDLATEPPGDQSSSSSPLSCCSSVTDHLGRLRTRKEKLRKRKRKRVERPKVSTFAMKSIFMPANEPAPWTQTS